MDPETGVISPGGIGFDINCGMRLLTTNLTEAEVRPKLKELVDLLFQRVPAGVGSSGFLKPSVAQFKELVEQGSKWCVEQGYGWEEDLERTEEDGTMKGADAAKISDRAIKRGLTQIGTLGSGNHYLEIQVAKHENVADKKTAEAFGINKDNQIVVMFHCLPGDAKVLTEHGYWIPIKDLEGRKVKVKCFNPESHEVLDTEIENFYKVKGKEKLFKIKTASGREIRATEDHPFLTKGGLKVPEELTAGEKVAILPFEGVEYEEPPSTIIVDENEVRKIHNSDELISQLVEQKLLPLRLNSEKLPLLAKLIGYLTGDGNLRKDGRGWRFILLGDVEDLEKARSDIAKLGFKTGDIRRKETSGKITTANGKVMEVKGVSHFIECHSSALSLLLIALGAPLGNKTIRKFEVPSWVSQSPKWIQRLYIAGYFGAELTKPIITTSRKKYEYFERPTLAAYKVEALKHNAERFLSQIAQILSRFGIESKVVEEKGAGRITQAGKTVKILLRISSDTENISRFYSRVNYEYCKRKAKESCYVLQYLISKQLSWEAKAKELNVSAKSVKFKPYQYEFEYPSFGAFVEEHKLNPLTPVIWDDIEIVEQIPGENYVYDIRVNDRNHTFIADNFVVGNCGSRGFGHQCATDYLGLFLNVMEKKYGIKILDRELACAPFSSKEGQDYFAAMKCAINMSFANRQVILHRIREVFSKVFGRSAEDLGMNQIYDVAHNTAKLESHVIDGKKKQVLVHRKGATRAFGPGWQELPAAYRHTGQPVIIGGSMETGSYLLAGTQKPDEETIAFATTAHGSGRTMSRTKAKHLFRGETLQKDMMKRGIYVKSTSWGGLAEEAGASYKDIDTIAEDTEKAGLSKRICKLTPIGNIKG
jgi:RNA-splicing ligase RtcB/uncharacterized protein YjhX (UPF0386 family)